MEKKRQFTWEELSLLNKEDNAHVAVRGKVYDVSKFLNRHPGGKDMLLMGAGRDVTIVFETYHAFSDSVQKVLEKYYVGELISDELPTFPERGLFYQTVRDRVKKYFKETDQDPKFSAWMWLRYIGIPTVLLLLWSAQMFWLADNFFLSCIAAAFMGWMCAMIGLVNNHDSSHCAVTSHPILWRVVGHIHDFLNGASFYIWIYQHAFGHHPYTNIDGLDPDIVTTEDHPDIRRIKWNQQWVPRYLYQHVYVPLVYCLLGLKTRIQDVTIMFLIKKNGVIRVNPPSRSQLTVFLGGKLFFLFYRVVLPCLLLSVWKMVVLFIIADIVASYWLALTFQASHVVSEVDWVDPEKDGKMTQDWAELQIQTTQDYATDSWFFNVFTGALNHQTTHHLFPGVSQIYYPEITPIVRETCKEFGVRYNYKDTFFQALGSHIGHLKRLGQQTQQHKFTSSRND